MFARIHRPQGVTDARIMHILVFACLLAAVSTAPIHESYDQRQDGKYNIRADVENIIFVIGIPKKLPDSVLSLLLKNSKRSGDEAIAQDRADVQSLKAFVVPNTPLQITIGPEVERSADADGGNVIDIAGQRRLEVESEPHKDMKLSGVTEQCGPEQRRDPATLKCISINDLRDAKLENTAEVVSVPA